MRFSAAVGVGIIASTLSSYGGDSAAVFSSLTAVYRDRVFGKPFTPDSDHVYGFVGAAGELT